MFQTLQTKQVGYKLFDLGNGSYRMVTSKGHFTGSLRQVCTFSVIELGFEIKELEIGVLEMEKHFHNAAEFGIFKSFMWSYDQEENNGFYKKVQ